MSLVFLTVYIYNRYFRYRDFKVLRASMRRWTRAQDGSVVTYQIELETKKNSDELIFEELWIEDKKFKLALTNSEHRIVASFRKKEVVNLDVLTESHFDNKEFTQEPPSPRKGEALLTYIVGNKRKFQSIKCFEERISGFELGSR